MNNGQRSPGGLLHANRNCVSCLSKNGVAKGHSFGPFLNDQDEGDYCLAPDFFPSCSVDVDIMSPAARGMYVCMYACIHAVSIEIIRERANISIITKKRRGTDGYISPIGQSKQRRSLAQQGNYQEE